jgi:hypothetical protein
MDVITQSTRDSRFGSVCEAITLISITLMLISLYLDSADVKNAGWWIFFAIVSVIGIVVCIAASYHQISETEQVEEHTEFRITFQLIETLKVKEMFADVIYGLEGLVKTKGDFTVTGKENFSRLLADTLGWERAKEVDGLIMKYAQGRNGTI